VRARAPLAKPNQKPGARQQVDVVLTDQPFWEERVDLEEQKGLCTLHKGLEAPFKPPEE
jgi:hypothetical protein